MELGRLLMKIGVANRNENANIALCIVKAKTKRKSQTCWFFSLSLADLGFVVFLMAATSHSLLSLLDGKLGQYWKVQVLHTVVGVFRGFLSTSNVITMIISLERCACVLAPLHAKTFLRTRFMAVVIVAVFVFVLGLYGLFNLKYVTVVRIDPLTNTTVYAPGLGKFYLRKKSVQI